MVTGLRNVNVGCLLNSGPVIKYLILGYWGIKLIREKYRYPFLVSRK